MTIAISISAVPANVLGALRPGRHRGPGVPAIELRRGQTLYAAGFRRGTSRVIHEVRINSGIIYIRVFEGWYTYDHDFAHINCP